MILVTGATGTVGREVVAQLRAAGRPVRALARKPVAAQLADGAEVVAGDLAEPGSLELLVRGAEAVFLVWPFNSPALTSELAPRVADVLARAGRVVYLSAPAAGEEPDSFWALTEQAVRESGAAWTFLRPSGFAKNTLIWAPQIKAGQVVRWPYGQAGRALIHEADLAEVAVAALTQDGHERQIYQPTGPAVWTQTEQVQIIAAALGRPLRWEEMPATEACGYLADMFGDPGFADHALASWAGFVEHPEAVTSAVLDITGHRARPLRQWVAEHTDDFR